MLLAYITSSYKIHATGADGVFSRGILTLSHVHSLSLIWNCFVMVVKACVCTYKTRDKVFFGIGASIRIVYSEKPWCLPGDSYTCSKQVLLKILMWTLSKQWSTTGRCFYMKAD